MSPTRVVLDPGTRILRAGGTLRVLGGDPVSLITPVPAAAALLDGAVIRADRPGSAALARALTDRGMAHPDVTRPRPLRPLEHVSVVVPVRDDAAGVDALLRGLRPELARGLQVVVVDDGSRTPVAETVRVAEIVRGPAASAASPAASVRVVRHDRARGPAAARNTGTAEAVRAGADVVVYLDADVIPLPGWLDLLLTHLDDPVVAAVAPRIVAADPGRFWMRGYETACSALDMGPAPARVRPRTRVPYVPSAALAVRPDRLPPAPEGAGVGPFDERMRVAEDVDLCWRTDAAGARIRYEPASRIAHRHRTGAARLLARREFYGRGAALLAERHGAHVAPAVVAPWSLAATAGVWSLTPLGFAVAAAATARAWWRTRALTGDGASAAVLVARGVGGSIRQVPEALLRPYWPVTAAVLLATASSRSRLVGALRRRLVVGALAEGLWHWWSHRDPGRMPADEPLGHLVIHRLDDLAYGLGVWRSAIAAGSAEALRPEVVRRGVG